MNVSKTLSDTKCHTCTHMMQTHKYAVQHTHTHTHTVTHIPMHFRMHAFMHICLVFYACLMLLAFRNCQVTSCKWHMQHVAQTRSRTFWFCFCLNYANICWLLAICCRNMKQARAASVNSKMTTTKKLTTTQAAAAVCTVAAVNFRTTCVKVNTCDMRIIPCGASITQQ